MRAGGPVIPSAIRYTLRAGGPVIPSAIRYTVRLGHGGPSRSLAPPGMRPGALCARPAAGDVTAPPARSGRRLAARSGAVPRASRGGAEHDEAEARVWRYR